MHDFYLAEIPEPVVLLGLRLRPYSLGHVILLHRIESAFVTGDGPVTIGDLAMSVLVCAHPYKEALALLDEPRLDKFMLRWHARLTAPTWWLRLRGQSRALDLKAKASAFAEYIEAGSKQPYYSYDVSKQGKSQLETVHAVQITLMSKTTLTEAELLDRPWGRCLFDYLALQAMDDKVTLMSEEGKSSIHEAKKFAEELAEKLATRNGHPRPQTPDHRP